VLAIALAPSCGGVCARLAGTRQPHANGGVSVGNDGVIGTRFALTSQKDNRLRPWRRQPRRRERRCRAPFVASSRPNCGKVVCVCNRCNERVSPSQLAAPSAVVASGFVARAVQRIPTLRPPAFWLPVEAVGSV